MITANQRITAIQVQILPNSENRMHFLPEYLQRNTSDWTKLKEKERIWSIMKCFHSSRASGILLHIQTYINYLQWSLLKYGSSAFKSAQELQLSHCREQTYIVFILVTYSQRFNSDYYALIINRSAVSSSEKPQLKRPCLLQEEYQLQIFSHCYEHQMKERKATMFNWSDWCQDVYF